MKLLLTIVFIAILTSTSFACDGTCACGGVPVPTGNQRTFEKARAVGEWAAYLVVGSGLAVNGVAVWPLGVPALCIYLSADQRAYNRAHGIKHGRQIRDGSRK